MKGKAIFRQMILCAVLLLALFLGSNILYQQFGEKIVVTGFDYGDELPFSSVDELEFIYDSEIISVVDKEVKGNVLFVYVKALKEGRSELGVRIKGDDSHYGYDLFEYEGGVIESLKNYNFNGCIFFEYTICLYFFLNMLTLFWASHKARKLLGFSYLSIFAFGFAIWVGYIFIVFLLKILENADVIDIYAVLTGLSRRFVEGSFLLVFIFSVLLCISNISLIRHERFRVNNVLAFVISFAMVFGFILLLVIDSLFVSGSEFQYNVFYTFVDSLYSIYALFECFLIGSVFNGAMAAMREPEYDKDFIIILGCKIKKDGTLFPLIRGRVDRAIDFYNKQLEKTGKKAVFIPSGGQGSDEIIAEAEAMERYLLSQGIPEEQIIVENKSKTTKENMLFSKRIIDERMPGAKAVFSTTNYHVFRSGIISRQAGVLADGMGSKTKWYFWPNAFIREVFGMFVYEWKILVVMFFPILAFSIYMRFFF